VPPSGGTTQATGWSGCAVEAQCATPSFYHLGTKIVTSTRGPHKVGFSLVELVATLAVISVMAVFALPRMVNRTGFESRGFYDQAQAVVRYAQKIAFAQRQSPPKAPVFVLITASQIRVCYDVACTSSVTDATTGAPLIVNAPAGVSLAPVTTFSFSGSGAPSFGAQLQVNVNGAGVSDVNRVFFVEAQTGYVHD
jgi:MSHA pilin protein MshC